MSELVDRLRKQVSDAVDWDGETLKRWDEIRGMTETRKGSDPPQQMFEDLIENLAEHMEEAVARIEALEAALRFYACDGHWMLNGQCDPNSSRFEGPNVARAVLDKDAGK